VIAPNAENPEVDGLSGLAFQRLWLILPQLLHSRVAPRER
jgi:hypothetical protein